MGGKRGWLVVENGCGWGYGTLVHLDNKISRNACMNDPTCVSVLNESREGELRTYSRERTYELHVRSQLVEVG